ncbi:hypothetical protein IMAU30025_01343 [Lactobacillus helveticus]|nr:hypothetical protein [Lactobacillus helveticus]
MPYKLHHSLLQSWVLQKLLQLILQSRRATRSFFVVKDTKNQKVTVYNKNAKKTSKKVAMGSTYTVKAVKKVHSTKIVRINKSQWLNTKDVVKD